MLVNILSNAVKFTPDGGTITFEAHCQENSEDGYINMHYCISDTGIGMSEEFIKEIFEEFAQEDSGARTQYHGAGLGMAIVKKYMERMLLRFSEFIRKAHLSKPIVIDEVIKIHRNLSNILSIYFFTIAIPSPLHGTRSHRNLPVQIPQNFFL